MKFSQKLRGRIIPEWKDAYVNYSCIKAFLRPFRIVKIAKRTLRGSPRKRSLSVVHRRASSIFAWVAEYDVTKIPDDINSEVEELEEFAARFDKYMLTEYKKISLFMELLLSEILRDFHLIKVNLLMLERELTKEKHLLKFALQQLFQKINFLQEFYIINGKALKKLACKQAQVMRSFRCMLMTPPTEAYKLFTNDCRLALIASTLRELEVKTQKAYTKAFFNEYSKNKAVSELRKVLNPPSLGKNQSMIFSFYAGCMTALFLILLYMLIYGFLDPNEDESFTYFFEMFRGIGLFTFFLWILALNVRGWNEFHINYKHLFNIKEHFSVTSEIMKRACTFTSIFIISFLWYVILQEASLLNYYLKDYFPRMYAPLVAWGAFLGYLFFPSKKIFNGPGRVFFFVALKNVIICRVDFLAQWCIDNTTSLVIPLQDFGKTACFYTHFWTAAESAYDICSDESFPFGFLAAFIPFFFKTSHVVLALSRKPSLSRIDFLIASRISSTFFLIIINFLAKKYPGENLLISFWIFLAVVSSVLNYIADLKIDWGFFENGTEYVFLRENLAYRRPFVYYGAMILNLPLRFTWVWATSVDVLSMYMRIEFIVMIVGAVEIIRRGIWNFFRVEFEHAKNLSQYKAFSHQALPFQDPSLFEIHSLMHKHLREHKFELEQLSSPRRDHDKKMQSERGRHGRKFNTSKEQDLSKNVSESEFEFTIINRSREEDLANQRATDSEFSLDRPFRSGMPTNTPITRRSPRNRKEPLMDIKENVIVESEFSDFEMEEELVDQAKDSERDSVKRPASGKSDFAEIDVTFYTRENLERMRTLLKEKIKESRELEHKAADVSNFEFMVRQKFFPSPDIPVML